MFFSRMKTFLMRESDEEEFDTIFFQGMGCSQTQALKYVGEQKIQATTGEMMWCIGRNNLAPIEVIYNLHIGLEIDDVNLNPFECFFSRFNPLKVIYSGLMYSENRRNGFRFDPETRNQPYSVAYHTIKLSQFNLGQETDMESHRKKYDSWLKKEKRAKSLTLYGVSRGTIATFCAFAKEKYPEVKLVVLEGAVDSVPDVLPKIVAGILKKDGISNRMHKVALRSLTFFQKHKIIKYRHDGPSPIDSIDEFPENVPVVFITSKADTVVPPENTETLAKALAARGKNDVYLLKLERAAHANYMFGDDEDRNTYLALVHAAYKKYKLKHNPELAKKGNLLLKECTLYEVKTKKSSYFSRFLKAVS